MRIVKPVISPLSSSPATILHCVTGWKRPCAISSSRDQIILIGVPGICLAMLTAVRTKSVAPRRPKPPPRWILYTSHCAGLSPAASAVAANAASPFCVGTHTSHRSGVHLTVAFIVSMHAWF